jgi:uncharacterized membrane protein YphA (DoxX/SURF4 family)
MTNAHLRIAARWSLTVLLLGLAATKSLSISGYSGPMPQAFLLLAACTEFAAGTLLLLGLIHKGALLSLAFFLGATIFSWSYGESCGCLGALDNGSQTLRVALAALGGLLACLLLDSPNDPAVSRKPLTD